MDLDAFATAIGTEKQFILIFEGAEKQSCFTGIKYIFYEIVAFIGNSDIRSSCSMIHYGTDDVILVYYAARIKAGYQKLRTFLGPEFSKLYTRKNIKQETDISKDTVIRIFEENKSDAIIIEEYGLQANKEYYGRFTGETYFLPPRGRRGPEKQTNIVLQVSDTPFPPQNELTPGYRGWSY
jgi:hypothetical protein